MPFCRHCGDLVLKDRCGKCGGRPVAASFSWNAGKPKSESPDRWKQTYTTDDSPNRAEPSKQPGKLDVSSSTPRQQEQERKPPAATATRRFPRPHNSSAINNRVSAHITATTSERTPSPTKQLSNAAALAQTLNSSPSSNPVLDDGITLSKVYGSVLQDPKNLKSYACANCDDIFTRDATLYPDPEEPTRMLCRHCFVSTSGLMGNCAACNKPVVRLKQEGQFVENSGKVWHKKCFQCEGCSKNISSEPSVDLYGRPCCPGCFDTSLHRPSKSNSTTPRKDSASYGSLGGTAPSVKDESPALQELSRRLGVSSRETTPSKIPVVSQITPNSKVRDSLGRTTGLDDSSPSRQVDDLTRRLRATTLDTATLRRSYGESWVKAGGIDTNSPVIDLESPTRPIVAGARRPSRTVDTPDLAPDVSDDAESVWSSPPTPKADGPSGLEDVDAACDKCGKQLFSVRGGGRIVTAPMHEGKAGRFHDTCFTCSICQKPFPEMAGTASFVMTDNGACHLQCMPAPTPKTVTKQRPVSVMPLPRSEPPTPIPTAPRPLSSMSSTSSSSVGNFQIPNRQRCAGCEKMVAVMEPGVVPGPRGTRWHSACLVCGGKGSKRRTGEPGCGKKLDRDAKLDHEGRTWCSNCMTLLILNGSITSATGKTPVSATFAGGWLGSQSTGSTVASHSTGSSTSTIQDQYNSSSRPTSLIQPNHTGNALPMLNRRSVSPTKGMLGGTVPVNRTLSMKKTMRPRPKSVSTLPSFGIGVGRFAPGMELVRETTGSETKGSS